MIDVAPIRLPRRDIAITGTSKNLLDAVGLDDLISLLKMTDRHVHVCYFN